MNIYQVYSSEDLKLCREWFWVLGLGVLAGIIVNLIF